MTRVECCKSLSKNLLFWVQRSICSMSAKQFDTAEQYLDTAYAVARRMPYFDTYQIDNHFAKLILTRCLEEGISPDCSRESQAQGLLDVLSSRNAMTYITHCQ